MRYIINIEYDTRYIPGIPGKYVTIFYINYVLIHICF